MKRIGPVRRDLVHFFPILLALLLRLGIVPGDMIVPMVGIIAMMVHFTLLICGNDNASVRERLRSKAVERQWPSMLSKRTSGPSPAMP